MAHLENLKIKIADRTATVTISREKVLNALDSQTVEELRAVFLDFRDDKRVGGVILTGAGEKAFVAGADIREMAAFQALQAREFSSRMHQTLDLIENLGKPVIAAINGLALGGGCELAMACHVRVASEQARLGQPEVKLGIIAGAGGTQRLARLVGKGRALEMLLLGEPVPAQEAWRIGLVNRVVPLPELLPACRSLLGQMLRNAPMALRYSIEAVRNGLEMPLEAGLFLEATLFGMCFATEDMREGTGAFLGKRPAVFRGQ